MNKVICAFPNCGRKILHRNSSTLGIKTFYVITEDYALRYNGTSYEENTRYPQNMITDVVGAYYDDRYDFVLCGYNPEVCDTLALLRIPYTLVFPTLELKEEYMSRAASRGFDSRFYYDFCNHYEEMLKKCQDDVNASEKFVLSDKEDTLMNTLIVNM